MSDSKRLRVLKLLTQWLRQEITVANGYKHDLSENVSRGRAVFTDADPLPLVAMRENPAPDRDHILGGGHDEPGSVNTSERWILLLQGWVVDDRENPTDPAYELMADVKKAIAKLYLTDTSEDNILIDMGGGDTAKAYYLDGLTNGFEIEPGTVRSPDEDASGKAFFWMRVILKFTEAVNDPYRYL